MDIENTKGKEMLFSSRTASTEISDMSSAGNSCEVLKPWKVMVIDDDDLIHSLTHVVLEDFGYRGRNIEIIDGYSGEQGCQLLKEHPDTAVLLLDVVMETDKAGLEVVDYVRKRLCNKLLRIILRTGQAGQGAEEYMVQQYDINDFRDKAELTLQKLNTAVVISLRAYEEMRMIQRFSNNNIDLKKMLKQQGNSKIYADTIEAI